MSKAMAENMKILTRGAVVSGSADTVCDSFALNTTGGNVLYYSVVLMGRLTQEKLKMELKIVEIYFLHYCSHR